jgi:cytoskeletal protein CcmA (bactofilin family)
MWNFSQTHPPAILPVSTTPPLQSAVCILTAGSNQSTIGKGLIVEGEITGSEPLFVDGTVEGSLDFPESRVTIGRSGLVTANITARDVVVLGTVFGNITASNLVDLHAEAKVTGDVTAARLSVQDGASFKGGIDILKTEARMEGTGESQSAEVAIPKPVRIAPPQPGNLRLLPIPQTA